MSNKQKRNSRPVPTLDKAGSDQPAAEPLLDAANSSTTPSSEPLMFSLTSPFYQPGKLERNREFYAAWNDLSYELLSNIRLKAEEIYLQMHSFVYQGGDDPLRDFMPTVMNYALSVFTNISDSHLEVPGEFTAGYQLLVLFNTVPDTKESALYPLVKDLFKLVEQFEELNPSSYSFSDLTLLSKN